MTTPAAPAPTLHDFLYWHNRERGGGLRDTPYSYQLAAAFRFLAAVRPGMRVDAALTLAGELADRLDD